MNQRTPRHVPSPYDAVTVAVLALAVCGAGFVDDASAQRVATDVARTNVNREVNVNRNVNRNVNVNVNAPYARRYDHPVATAAAVTAGIAVTAAVVGSIVRTLPPSCTAVVSGGFTYQQCGTVWYQPQYAGTQVTYVVVNPPR
ncbi:hypothetical protein ACSFBM_00085 [Variovorax sp. GB1R11]|uniref:hypothetical protein n=1 Tax=Variovorax sp. GB1R11 TaxID=3443741 RepID=UPI003F44E268